MHFLDRVSGDNLQPLHQCLILFRRDLQCLFFCTGPAETAKLQPFVEEKESIAFPWNDPEIGVEWPEVCGEYQGTASAEGYKMQDGTELTLSDKDQKWAGLKDTFKFEK